MAVCQICGKKATTQKSGAHRYGGGWSMRAPKKRRVWKANLQKAKVLVDGVYKKVTICAKCLKKAKKENKVYSYLPKEEKFSVPA